MDDETIAVYDAKAADYQARFCKETPCGPGSAAKAMVDAGHEVEAWDASVEMVRIACEAGVNATLKRFDDLTVSASFDGIWANFSLLHADRADVPRHLTACAEALTKGGCLHLGMKTGEGAERDQLGRHYCYFTVDELGEMLAAAGLGVIHQREGEERGLAGTLDPWVTFLAQKSDA